MKRKTSPRIIITLDQARLRQGKSDVETRKRPDIKAEERVLVLEDVLGFLSFVGTARRRSKILRLDTSLPLRSVTTWA
jgi:hypothetical protein